MEKKSLTSLLLNLCAFYFCIALITASSIMLNRNSKSRCFYHFPNFNGKAFNILLLTIMLTVGFSRYLLSGWRESLVCWDFPFNSELMSIFFRLCDYHMVLVGFFFFFGLKKIVYFSLMKRGQESVHGWFGGFLVSRTSAPPILLHTMHEFYFQIHLMAQYGCWSANNYICSPGTKRQREQEWRNTLFHFHLCLLG